MEKDKRYAAVIFDLDGLVLDTERLARDCWMRAVKDFGLELKEETYQKVIGLTTPDIKVVLHETFGEGFDAERLFEHAYRYYNEHIDTKGVEIKAGVLEMLAVLEEAGLAKAVATSSSRSFAIRKLSVCGLLERFDTLVCGDDVQNGKPAPDIFLAAARKLKTEAEKCIVFEDSDNGVRAAHKAGMMVIMIPDLKRPAKEVEKMADEIFESLNEAIPFLKSMLVLLRQGYGG